MRAAQKIALRLKDTEIISMRSNPNDVPATDADVIGFIYPVYHWTMPEPAAKFISELSINPNAYIFVVAMPSFVVGHACERLEELLVSKGAHISYGAKVHCVGNYVISYPPIPPPRFVVPRTEKRLDKIGAHILAKKTRAIPKAGFIVRNKFPQIMPHYMKLSPIADYGFYINKQCTACGLCSKLCPCGNIELVNKTPTFKHKCSQCMACVCYCPNRAIGYNMPKNSSEYLSNNLLDVTLVKMMSLPTKRKIYHNPYISSADIIKNRIKVD